MSSINTLKETQENEKKKRVIKKKTKKEEPIEEKKIETPPIKNFNQWGLDMQLYPHQQYSVQKMEYLEQNVDRTYKHQSMSAKITSHIGFLADSVGSGKTLTTISLLARTKDQYDNIGKDDETINTIICNKQRSFFSYQNWTTTFVKYIPINIIVVGNSVFNQWVNELSHSTLKYKVISKNADMINPIGWFEKFDVVIITYNRYKDFHTLLNYDYRNGNPICVRRLIFDEIQASGRLPELKAKFYWIVSANISMHNYNYSERDKRTNFICDLLGSTLVNYVTIKNSKEQIEESFRHAEVKNVFYDCLMRQFSVIKDYLPNEIQRMIAADDLAGAISALGGTSDTVSLTDIIIKKEEKHIKEIEASIQYHTIMNNQEKIREYENKLQFSKEALEKLKDRISRNEEEECSVCCLEFEEKVLTNCCKGILCGNCIKNLIKGTNKCPFCREKLNMSKMIISKVKVEEELKEEEKVPQKFSKLETVINIIKSKKDGKFLLFSEFWPTFDQIKEELSANNISFAEVKGTTDTKQKHIREFKAGLTKVLFLNARHDGTGINLPETTDIILYHKISTENLENQVLGRALRLGRTAPLTVHRLLSEQEKALGNDPRAVDHLHSQQYNPADDERRIERERQEREDYQLALELSRRVE